MSIKLLLTDTTSPLGQAVFHELERENIHLLVPSFEECNWSKREATNAYFRQHHPQIVINTFAFDRLHQPSGPSDFVNASMNLAAASGIAEIPLLHVSSYGVFSGDTKSAHAEKDIPKPVDALGQVLAQAERQIAELAPRHICLRASWLIGPYGDNLLTQFLAGFFDGKPIHIQHHAKGAPTTYADFARVLVALAKQISCGSQNWGVMHYCSPDSCTQEEFFEQLMQLLIQHQLLQSEPVIAEDTELPEAYTSAVLTCKLVRDYFGVQGRSWRPSLLPMVKQWLHSREQANS